MVLLIDDDDVLDRSERALTAFAFCKCGRGPRDCADQCKQRCKTPGHRNPLGLPPNCSSHGGRGGLMAGGWIGEGETRLGSLNELRGAARGRAPPPAFTLRPGPPP